MFDVILVSAAIWRSSTAQDRYCRRHACSQAAQHQAASHQRGQVRWSIGSAASTARSWLCNGLSVSMWLNVWMQSQVCFHVW